MTHPKRADRGKRGECVNANLKLFSVFLYIIDNQISLVFWFAPDYSRSLRSQSQTCFTRSAITFENLQDITAGQSSYMADVATATR